MVSPAIGMSQSDAIEAYGLMPGLLLFFYLFGALLGDLVLGNKKVILLGGILQAMGAFTFCIPEITMVYVAIILHSLGSALLAPNIFASFGKRLLSYDNPKQTSFGFMSIYMVANLSGFIAPLILGSIASQEQWSIAFVIIGIVSLLSIIPMLKLQEQKFKAVTQPSTSTLIAIALKIMGAFVITGILSASYLLLGDVFYKVSSTLESATSFQIKASMWTVFNGFVTVAFGVILLLLWRFIHISQATKFILGCFSAILSFFFLWTVAQNTTDETAFLFVLHIIFAGIAEVLIFPTLYMVILEKANPKYITIVISLGIIVLQHFSGIFKPIINTSPSEEQETMIFLLSGLILLIALVSLLVYRLFFRKNRETIWVEDERIEKEQQVLI
ncbi:hypothetical protein GCM10023331_20970 [Algivirga pacifica]|uniref:Major facilitator superfamily (MFS) profile domain-containing protein n=2 Tax=Algivirga pacifica TaxID=1162670 RepID=A0ABP9D952_9BACT